jgi:LysR family transcriptional regulator, benzoate and cis,cis-muconate-responsive activator of ben and cat genes
VGETFPRWREEDPDTGGPLIRDTGQVTQLVALGRVVAVLPASSRTHLRRDLVAIPVLDGTLLTLMLAWPEESRSRALAAFVRTAAAVASETRLADVGA